MAYLEQSTRYVPYADRPGGRWRYHVPAESARPRARARATSRRSTACSRPTRAGSSRCSEHFRAAPSRGRPRTPTSSTARPSAPRRSTPCAGSCRRRRGRTWASSAPARRYEALLLRMRAHPLAEARDCAELMLAELRKVIPAFLRRVDAPRARRRLVGLPRARRARRGRGVGGGPLARQIAAGAAPEVTLTDFDPEGEVKVVAAALYAVSGLPDDQLLALARRMTAERARARCCAPTSGERANRRHKPGRAFERTRYRFDVLGDYGAFRDLQRHRLLTLEWQPLSRGTATPCPRRSSEAGARRRLAPGHGRRRPRSTTRSSAAGLARGGALRRGHGLPRSASTWR